MYSTDNHKDPPFVSVSTAVTGASSAKPAIPAASVKATELHGFNEESNDYKYSELPPNSIRLLILHPGSDAPVRCSLTIAVHAQAPSYEALSYVWGTQADPATIDLCSHDFEITKNLHDALHALRLPDCDRVLWVDALCINQTNDGEKQIHIPLMGKIYGHAKEVVAWLGLPTNDVIECLRWLDKQELHPDLFLTVSASTALDSLMGLKYWRRAWIVQEIAFAQSFSIRCGHYSMPYKALEHARRIQNRAIIAALPVESKVFTSRIIAPTPRRDQWLPPGSGNAGAVSVELFLEHLTSKECANGSDSIYAFYSLFSQDLQSRLLSLKSDYRKPRDVLLGAIREMILESRSLYAITIRGRQKTPDGEENVWQLDMPSWCPHVRTPFKIGSLTVFGQFEFGTNKMELDFEYDDNLLRVRGFVIAEVSGTLKRYRYKYRHLVREGREEYSNKEKKHIRKNYRECLRFGLRLPPEQPGCGEAGSEPVRFEGGILHMTDTNDPCGDDISEAIRYWRHTESRLVCKVTILGANAQVTVSDDDAEGSHNQDEWIDLPDVAVLPRTCIRGDIICGIVGCPSPVVLRKHRCDGQGTQTYKVLGEAYIGEFQGYATTTDHRFFLLC